MANPIPATVGIDHVGLSVGKLESTRRFFCDCLGWKVVGERPDYPAVFISDDCLIVTLWRVESPAAPSRLTGAPMSACITLRWPWLIVQGWMRSTNASRVGRTLSWNSLRSSPGKDRRSISWCGNQAAFGLNSPTILASKQPASGSDKTCRV